MKSTGPLKCAIAGFLYIVNYGKASQYAYTPVEFILTFDSVMFIQLQSVLLIEISNLHTIYYFEISNLHTIYYPPRLRGSLGPRYPPPSSSSSSSSSLSRSRMVSFRESGEKSSSRPTGRTERSSYIRFLVAFLYHRHLFIYMKLHAYYHPTLCSPFPYEGLALKWRPMWGSNPQPRD